MCIKCGCGKKKGQAGYGMGKPKANSVMGKVTKRVAKKTAVVRKKGM